MVLTLHPLLDFDARMAALPVEKRLAVLQRFAVLAEGQPMTPPNIHRLLQVAYADCTTR